MDKSAHPTPKADTVSTPEPEPGGKAEEEPEQVQRGSPEGSRSRTAPVTAEHPESQDKAFKQRVRECLIELQTEGDLVTHVGGHHETHVTGSATHTIGSKLLTRVGGSEIDAVGGSYLATSPQRAVFNGAEEKISGLAIKHYAVEFERAWRSHRVNQLRTELTDEIDQTMVRVLQIIGEQDDVQGRHANVGGEVNQFSQNLVQNIIEILILGVSLTAIVTASRSVGQSSTIVMENHTQL